MAALDWRDVHSEAVMVDLHVHPSLQQQLFRRNLDLRYVIHRTFHGNPLEVRASFPRLKEGGFDIIFSTIYVPEQGIRGLVLSGGDTALLVCRALGAHGICLKGQIVLGIPWGTLIGGHAHGLPVATKAGGFGAPDALVRAADFLSRQREYVNEH